MHLPLHNGFRALLPSGPSLVLRFELSMQTVVSFNVTIIHVDGFWYFLRYSVQYIVLNGPIEIAEDT